MQAAQDNSHTQVLEMPMFPLMVDQLWKQRDEAVWEKLVQPLLTPSSVVLDAGGGPGRLLPRLWGAQKVVLAEPDPVYYLKAKAMGASLSQGDQATIDEVLATGFARTISDRLRSIAQDAKPTAKCQVLNVPMFDPIIAEHGPFDLIICSHVVEHVPFRVIQEAVAAFYTFLKPAGKLIIYGSKAPLLCHWINKFDASGISYEISTYEAFAQLAQTTQTTGYSNFYSGGLPIRYFPFDLFAAILKEPFAPTLQMDFPMEFQAQPTHEQYTSHASFTVTAWEAYHTHMYPNSTLPTGIYPEYHQIQGWLNLPLKPIESVGEALALEDAVNQHAVLKRLFLIDMIVVAQKAA
jgi:SAM-dependent methyltransferase